MVLLQLVIIASIVGFIYTISKSTNRLDYYSQEIMIMYHYLYNKVAILNYMMIDVSFIVLALLYFNWVLVRYLFEERKIVKNKNYIKKGRFFTRKKLLKLRVEVYFLEQLNLYYFTLYNVVILRFKFLKFFFSQFSQVIKRVVYLSLSNYLDVEDSYEIIMFFFLFSFFFIMSIFPWFLFYLS